MSRKVLLILGKSGVGKSTIAKRICEKSDCNYIKSYTTRVKRGAEDDDHIFLDKKEFMETFDNNLFLAMQRIGGEYYGVLLNQFEEDKINVYIIDELGLIDFQNSLKLLDDGEWCVLTCMITREELDVDMVRANRVVVSDYTWSFIDGVFCNNGEVDDVVGRIVSFMGDWGFLNWKKI